MAYGRLRRFDKIMMYKYSTCAEKLQLLPLLYLVFTHYTTLVLYYFQAFEALSKQNIRTDSSFYQLMLSCYLRS